MRLGSLFSYNAHRYPKLGLRFCSAKYVVVNNDTLKSMAKCRTVARTALRDGKSVVVDNTNPSKKARARFISLISSLAIQSKCRVRAICVDTDQNTVGAGH